MKTKSRIASVLEANMLDCSITGFESFNLSDLEVATDLKFRLPINLRLGHLVERIVSELIKASTNYVVLYENTQIIENKQTIGELDFIIENMITKRLIHMELAYKFYLFDPSMSSKPINNWIGPDRNDSLIKKLEKLKKKQFPLIHHQCAKPTFAEIAIGEVDQALCFLVSLFIPYQYKSTIDPVFEKAIKGYYLKFDTFLSIHDSSKTYHLPAKRAWGINPTENDIWADFSDVEKQISDSLEEKQSVLCWQKCKGQCLAFFITWW